MRKNIYSLTLIFVAGILASRAQATPTVGGYVDAQLFTPTSAPRATGFKVAEGELNLSETIGSTSAKIAIPYAFSATSTASSFSVGQGRAQAFVSHGYDFGLTWTLGQFVGLYGYEQIQSINNRFSSIGIIRAASPATHTGATFGYKSGNIEVIGLVANPHSTVLLAGDNFDLGGQVKFSQDKMYVSAGYLHHKERSTALSSMLADLTAGTKMDDFSVDLEVVMAKAARTAAETGMGFGGWFAYAFNKTWSAGTRLEYTTKMTSHSVMQATVGPQAQITDKLSAKFDYTFTTSKALSTSTTSTSLHTGAIAALYKF